MDQEIQALGEEEAPRLLQVIASPRVETAELPPLTASLRKASSDAFEIQRGQ